jgi:4-hydroxythreonine-4-phosphate dehydrogenase
MGDPGGIGPEVTVKALAEASRRSGARVHVYGSMGPMLAAAERAEIEPFWWRVPVGSVIAETALVHDVLLLDHADGEGAWPARATAAGGAASFGYLERAMEAARRPEGDAFRPGAIVTAPISKEAWALAGHGEFAGHTELLAARFRAARVRMMFVAPNLRVMLATTHVPIAKVPGLLTIGRVSDTIDLAQESCARLGIPRPRIAVCGLNPHAGEAGLMGDEDGRVIEPAVRLARERGIDASGPWPGDTIFGAAVKGRYDIVVAMYHDQGLIPVKLLAFDRAVNMTAGLPVVRTSPDHGTAFDIAGRNLADAGSMAAAIDLAVRLSAGGGGRVGEGFTPPR